MFTIFLKKVFKTLFYVVLVLALIKMGMTILPYRIEKKILIEFHQNQTKPITGLNLIDLKSNLEPGNVFEEIKCRLSEKIIVETTLCVHDLSKDVYVSLSIWNAGSWERHILSHFMNSLVNNPDSLVLDIGANLGQYSLFAAKFGNKVVAVEPFYDNLLRIRKASKLENLDSKITLIQNAVSDRRNEIKLLGKDSLNVGGQSILGNDQLYTREQMKTNKYLVETILFDDLIDYLPKDEKNQNFQKGVMKIDIQGSEPYAFRNASKLFDIIDFKIIFMEWDLMPKENNVQIVLDMMEFFYSRNFMAYDVNKLLERKNWKLWPYDIVWRKTT